MTTSSDNTAPRETGLTLHDAPPDSSADRRVRMLEERLRRVQEENDFLKRQWQEATSSMSWRIVTAISGLMRQAAPPGSRRRTCLKSVWRSAVSLRFRGPVSWARRTAAQLEHQIISKVQLFRARSRPIVADDRPTVLFVSHIGGGGTERHLRDMAARLAREGVRTVIARPDGHGRLLFEEHDTTWQMLRQKRTKPTRQAIASMLGTIRPGLVHVHHRMGVPETLFDVIRDQGIVTDWTLHDYHAVCPRIHLNDATGRYCGEPSPEGCRACLKRSGDYHGRPVDTDVVAYREAWRERLAGARRVYVPSDDVRKRMARYFPELPIHVRPHIEPNRPARLLARTWEPGERVRVAVIGTIGAIKGSARLLAAAEDARRRDLPLEFVLVGTSDQEPRLLATGRVEVTGPYLETEIWERLDEAACHLAWLPSIWPETYMYTLSLALAAGFRPFVYDLGAQAERLADPDTGHRLPLDTPAAAVNAAFLEGAARQGPKRPHRFAEYPDFLADYYGLTADELKQPRHLRAERHRAAPANGFATAPHDITRSENARLHQHHRQLSA